jgi:hypothetical protein
VVAELSRDPVAAWTDAMRRGDFASAWAIGDGLIAARRPGETCWERPRHQQWVWDGTPLDGRRVLVRCYHGLGDTLQFARFLPRLHAITSETTVWVQPQLLSLLGTMGSSIGRLLPLHDGDPGVDYDADIEIMELPHALRTVPMDLPGPIPYLHVPPATRLSSRFSVGVLVEAGDWDDRRSIPPELVDLRIKGVEPFSLQLGTPLPGMVDASTADALELGARLQGLDLVISVDTMLAHLAGALGVATWLLLPAEADWRWMTDRHDSPWYPSMRLFRQPRPGDWAPVLRDVRNALQVMCAR